jgi:Aldo/keto reductase family
MITNSVVHPDWKAVANCLDFFQLFVPPPFQLAGCKPIPGIHRVVLFEGLLCLTHQLLELAGQGGTLSGATATPNSMQNLVNLLYREEEREMLPLCAAEGIGVIPWSPQARGRLTRDWDYTSMRTESDDLRPPARSPFAITDGELWPG